MGYEMGNNKSTLQEEDNSSIGSKEKSLQEDVNRQISKGKGPPTGLVLSDDRNQNASNGRDEDQVVHANDFKVQNDIIHETQSEDVHEKKTELASGYSNGVIDRQVETHIASNEKDYQGKYQKPKYSTFEENQLETNNHQLEKKISISRDDARKSYLGEPELHDSADLKPDQTELAKISTNQSIENGIESGLTSTSEQNIGNANSGEITRTSDLASTKARNLKLQKDMNMTVSESEKDCLVVVEQQKNLIEKESETEDRKEDDETKELKVDKMAISDHEDNNNFEPDEAKVMKENLAVDVAVNNQNSEGEDAKGSEKLPDKNEAKSQDQEGKSEEKKILLPHRQECSGDGSTNSDTKSEEVKDPVHVSDESKFASNETKVESICSSIESELNISKVHPHMQKSPSFCFDRRMEERSEESDQTPLLFKNKATTNVGTKYESMMAVQEKVIISDSDKSRTPFPGFSKEEDKVLVNVAMNPENESAAEKAKKEASRPALTKLKEKRRSTLFGTCMCCASVIN